MYQCLLEWSQENRNDRQKLYGCKLLCLSPPVLRGRQECDPTFKETLLYTAVSIYQSMTNKVALHNLAIMYGIYRQIDKLYTLLLDYGGQHYWL